MNFLSQKSCGVAFALACGLGLCAGTVSANEPKAFSAQAELGIFSSGGNSESQSVNARFSGAYDLEHWRYTGGIMGISASSSDPNILGSEVVTSAERYGLDLQADRKLENDHSLFAKLNYDDDRFSGFDYEAGFAVGYGYQVLKSEQRNFRIEIGPGFRVSKPEVGDEQDEAVLSSAFLYNQTLGQTSSFQQTLLVDAGEERAISTSVTSLSAQIYGQLAMKLALTFKHNSEPAVDVASVRKASVDRETSVNLVYSF